MAMNLNPKSPLLLGALLLGGFWLVSRRAAVATTAKPAVIQGGQQSYHTPTAVADVLGAFVASYTKGAQSKPASDNVAVPESTSSLFSDWFNANYGKDAGAGGLGVWDWSASSTPGLFDGWSKPLPSLVQGLLPQSASDDSASGAVYSLTDDFKLNEQLGFY